MTQQFHSEVYTQITENRCSNIYILISWVTSAGQGHIWPRRVVCAIPQQGKQRTAGAGRAGQVTSVVYMVGVKRGS